MEYRWLNDYKGLPSLHDAFYITGRNNSYIRTKFVIRRFMKVAVPKETKEKERRVSLTPDVVKRLIGEGFECIIEIGAGSNSYFSDEDYAEAGAFIVEDKNKLYAEADVILKVNPPSPDEVGLMKPEAVLISLIWTFANMDIVEACVKRGISCFAMEAIPRI